MAKDIRLEAHCQRVIGLLAAIITIVTIILCFIKEMYIDKPSEFFTAFGCLSILFLIFILAAYCLAILLKKQKAVLVILLILVGTWVIPFVILLATFFDLIEFGGFLGATDLDGFSNFGWNICILAIWPMMVWNFATSGDFATFSMVAIILPFTLITFLLFVGWFGTKKLVRIEGETSEILQEDNGESQ